MKNIMIDIETLSNKPNAAIVAIGAVQFDIDTGELGGEISLNIDPSSAQKAGLDVDANTVMWWMCQSEMAREKTFFPKCPKAVLPLDESLTNLCLWWVKGATLWSHATFDAVILRNAFGAVGIQTPWHYRDTRDIRTIYDLAKRKGYTDSLVARPDGNTAHSALDDAIYQAQYVSAMWNCLKSGVR